ncbi:MAG: UvrD-helicase domain-containing protein [Deltaproteobacteria bacterium]|nr:UvrD-helicase domain-containing protein [Deltaproteobacteria bacterium]
MLDLGSLNSRQREAVVHEGGPLVVFAGAGSGKTRVITYRVAHLISAHDVAPWRILAVTFTNKAAGEMLERLLGLLGDRGAAVQVGTFHATCARFLRRHGESLGISKDFTIYDDQDQLALVKRVLRDLGLDEKRYQPKAIAGRINRAKQEVQGPESIETPDPWSEVVRRVYATYEERLIQANALDFGDLIFRTVRGLEADDSFREALAGRFSHVLVDEFQDTNQAQFRLVRSLSEGHRNLCVVGDDDQSIYRWRGADRRNILDFRASFPDATLVKLEQNYRSTQRILRAANAVIARNTDREPKKLWTDNEEGDAVLVVRTMDERDEARLVLRGVQELLAQGYRFSDVAVFYRTHAQSRVIEEALRSANIGYRIVGGMRFYDRAEVKDLLAYLRVTINPADDMSLLRIINTPARGIGKTTVTRLLDLAAQHGRSLWGILEEESLWALRNATQKRLAGFRTLISDLREVAASDAPLGEIGAALVERTGYAEMLMHDDTPEADARLQNVQELAASMDEFQREHPDAVLADFLENVTLHTSADERAEGDRVTLMTVHAAKGLEFPIVMVTGLEEQVFPFKGIDPWEDPEELEEERRLAYVAFTRAKERLVLSFAAVRRIFGQQRVGIPSRFLNELPAEDTSWIGSKSSWPLPRPAEPRTPERPSTDSYVDYSEGSDVTDISGLRRGMQVRHPKFGVGEVREVMLGTPPRVSVRFPEWGTRKIIASYLEPA